MIDPRLEGRVLLVTGGNSGIGSEVVRRFAGQGALVAIHYLEAAVEVADPEISVEHEVPGRQAAEALLHEVRDLGSEAVLVGADLGDPHAAARIFDAAEKLGPVSVLVNNAAHCELPDDVLNATAGGIDRHFAVNARAPVLLTREFAERHQQRGDSGGSIINISTDAARTFATQIGYGASKAALEAFTRSAAIELGPLGITVNAVAPGPVQTGWISAELEEGVVPSIPLRRIGVPSDIADAVVFLASEQARWITGQVLQVAGGHAL
jgi:3-oxoacyl-[acyl-carrier protein] reductase